MESAGRKTEIQQSTSLDLQSPSLSSLETQMQSELQDREVRVHQSSSKGTIHLEIQEATLADFLSRLQQHKASMANVGQEDLQGEICALKAQLEAARAENSCPIGAQSQGGKEQDGKVAEALRRHERQALQKCQSQHTEELSKQMWKDKALIRKATDDLQKAEAMHFQQITAISQELEAARAELNAQKQCNGKLSAALNKAQQGVKSGHLEWPQEKVFLTSALGAAQATIATLQNQLETAMGKAEGVTTTAPPQWEEEKAALTGALEKSQGTCRYQLETIAALVKRVEDAEREQTTDQYPHQAQQRKHNAEIKKITAALKAAESKLHHETQRFQQETAAMQDQMERTRASSLAQEKELKDENSSLIAALVKAKVQHNTECEQWEKEKDSLTAEKDKSWANYQTQLELTASLQNEVEALKMTLKMSKGVRQAQQEKQEAKNREIAAALKETQELLQTERLRHHQETVSIKEEVEQSKASFLAQLEQNHRAQLESQEKNHQILMDTMKKRFEDQLVRERIQHQEEKVSMLEENNRTTTSYLTQLDQQRQRNDTLVAALEKAEELKKSNRAEWQEATASLKTALQDKEQEWARKEAAITSQLEELQSQINNRRNRRKWYKFF